MHEYTIFHVYDNFVRKTANKEQNVNKYNYSVFSFQ